MCVQCVFHRTFRSRLVIVVHKIHLVSATISRTVVPVIYHVIENIETSGIVPVAVQSSCQAPVAARAVSQQIVVETTLLTADTCRITVSRSNRIVLVAGHIQSLGNQGTLQGDIFPVARTECFVNGPTDGAMIDDAMVAARHTHTVVSLSFTQTNTYIAHDNILSPTQSERSATDTNSFAGSRLPCHSDVRLSQRKPGLQLNDSRNGKNNRAGSNIICHGSTQATRTVIIEIGNLNHFTATATTGKTAIPFRVRECQLTRAEIPDVAFGDESGSGHFIHPPVVGVHAVEIIEHKCGVGLCALVE